MKNLELFSFSLNDRHRRWRDIKRDPFVQFRSRKIIETGAKFIKSEPQKPLFYKLKDWEEQERA